MTLTKIDDITAIDNAATDTTIMKIDAKHFYVIISTGFKRRYLAYSIKTAVYQKANKCTQNKSNDCIIRKTTATNADCNEYG